MKTLLLSVLAVLFGLLSVVSQAGSQDGPPAVTGENGNVFLGSLEAPAAGSACTAVTGNNESVHPKNRLIVEQASGVVVDEHIETAPNDGYTFSFTSDGSAIQWYVALGNRVTSAEAVVTCEAVPVTTTTVSSTVPDESTTTVPEEESTTTTVPEEESTTTTTVPDEPTTTTTTVDENCPPDGLACTGGEASLSFAFGLLFLVLGGIFLVAKELIAP